MAEQREIRQAAFERRTESWLGMAETVWTRWTLIGPDGAISFRVRVGGGLEPCTWGIDGHHKRPPEHHEFCAHNENCEYVGGECWSDGTALGAREVWAKLIATGTEKQYPDMEVMWAELVDYYDSWFGPAAVSRTTSKPNPNESKELDQ